MRDGIVAALSAHAEEVGKEAEMPFDQVAAMTCVMSNGFALEKMLEGDEVADELHGTMLMIFFAGLDALKGAPAPATAGAIDA